MRSLSSTHFDIQRNQIRKFREEGRTWKDIKYQGENDNDLEMFIKTARTMFSWDITSEEWKKLVELEKNHEEEIAQISFFDKHSIISKDDNYNEVDIPLTEESGWQCYRRYLLDEQKFALNDVEAIERSSQRILQRLNGQTKGDAVKGLVIGNVQSGKTANMEGLMSVAADYGWNMFIVLSGTIENLRLQTLGRMTKDLNREGSNFAWQGITHPSRNCELSYKTQHLHFEKSSKVRYLTVVLKNYKRLEDLIQWLHDDPNTSAQMKILVIDDEADQASVNTGDREERKRINKLLVNLVNNKDVNGNETRTLFQAMNYIGYTATPYANVLNEAWEESLYPKDFISTLQVPKTYFGPQQIFGDRARASSEYEGLNIVRSVSDEDLKIIGRIHKGESLAIPTSLENSVAWFLCCSATFRFWGYRKPVSMLIHTNQKQIPHEYVHQGVKKWFCNSEAAITKKCKEVWEEEVGSFTKEDLYSGYPGFSTNPEDINNYPEFGDILPYIKQLIEYPTSIKMGDDDIPRYSRSVHICVDNCSNNRVDADGTFLRLIYPDDKHKLDYSPAFIVIGGNTLSRGLTIEGLTSTFFLRSTKQGDTLMQMGRWFGYRRGYELLQRIWMTDKAQMQFEFLADLDSELRKCISEMEQFEKKPSDYAVSVKSSPAVNFIRITAANRMQGAVRANMNYSGLNTQTHLFIENDETLKMNYATTEAFINGLGKPEQGAGEKSRSCAVWRGIPFEKIYKGLINPYEFHEKLHSFSEKEALYKWVKKVTEKGELTNWNVILFGNDTGPEASFKYTRVHKVHRTRATLREGQDTIDIKILTDPDEKIADVRYLDLPEEIKPLYDKYETKNILEIRNKAGLGKTPTLVIYVIDKDSKASERSLRSPNGRRNLGVDTDLIGISINVPGDRINDSYAETVQINLEKYKSECDVEDAE